MTTESNKEETTIVATGDGGVSFGTTAPDQPIAAAAILGKVAEYVTDERFGEGEVIARMDGWDTETLELETKNKAMEENQ